jgi:hypothetical protein
MTNNELLRLIKSKYCPHDILPDMDDAQYENLMENCDILHEKHAYAKACRICWATALKEYRHE